VNDGKVTVIASGYHLRMVYVSAPSVLNNFISFCRKNTCIS